MLNKIWNHVFNIVTEPFCGLFHLIYAAILISIIYVVSLASFIIIGAVILHIVYLLGGLGVILITLLALYLISFLKQ